MLDFEAFSHLSFDCYGTLIDWESGILATLGAVLERHGIALSDDDIIRRYAGFEAELEAGDFMPYREVLRGVMERFARVLDFHADEEDLAALPESVGSWPPFPDTRRALERLAGRYRLVILSNVDDRMFEETEVLLGRTFDEVVTAEQIGSYKPAERHFEVALDRLELEPTRLLHVAQSLYHDHVPARRLGLATAWINRRSRLPGRGVAPEAVASPSLEVPDLGTLADLAGV